MSKSTRKTQSPAVASPVVAVKPVPLDILSLVGAKPKDLVGMNADLLVRAIGEDQRMKNHEDLSRSYVRALTLPFILSEGVDRKTYCANTGIGNSYVSELLTYSVAVGLGFGPTADPKSAKSREWVRLTQGIKVPAVRQVLRSKDVTPTAKMIRDALRLHTLPNGDPVPAPVVIDRTPSASAPEGPTPSGAEIAAVETRDAASAAEVKARAEAATSKTVLPSLDQIEAWLATVAAKPTTIAKGKRADMAERLTAALDALNGTVA